MLMLSRFLCASLCVFSTMTAFAQTSEPPLPASPRIGLVLGGGGARGAAHIGVLEVLENLQIPISCVAGTSMGALIAGAYASGLSPTQMREAMGKADWSDMFIDSPEFSDIALRKKQIMRRYVPSTETGISSAGVKYTSGAVDGEKIKLFFNSLVGAGRSERLIERLPMKVSLLATDIGSGERVVMREGSLTTAMRASMSVPGLLAPVERDGRKLVDGGLVDNVPISEARSRCDADVLIVVNVGSPLMKAEDVGSLLSVSAQMVNLLTEQNVTRSLADLKLTDIYIKPELGTITAGDFGRNAEAADIGRTAADAVRDKLAKLSVDQEKYVQWRAPIERHSKAAAKIDEIEIVGLRGVNPALVQRQLSVKPGAVVDLAAIENDVLRIYGDGYYQSVDYRLLTQRERNILQILPLEKSWGPDYLRFALNLEADTHQGSSFSLGGAYHRTLMNSYGAEMIISGEVGSRVRAGFEFYQPVDPAHHFFVETSLKYERVPWGVYQNNDRIAQYDKATSSATVTAGANLGLVGQARLSWIEQKRTTDLDIGLSALPNFSTRYGGWRASLAFDQTNRLYFASKGWGANFSYFDSKEAGYSRADLDLSGAFSVGNTVLTGRFAHTSSPSGRLPFYDSASLGGFLNMSAFARGQVIGDNVNYFGLRAERIIGSLGLGLRGDVRFGIALEAANVGRFYTETNLAKESFLNSAAVYFGSETPFGPAYVGYGYSTSGASNLFLSIGIP